MTVFIPFLQRYSQSQLTTLTATVAFTTIITWQRLELLPVHINSCKTIDGHQGHEIMLEMETCNTLPLRPGGANVHLAVRGQLFCCPSHCCLFLSCTHTNTHRPLCIQSLTFIYLSKCIRQKRWNQLGGLLLACQIASDLHQIIFPPSL